MKTRSVHLLYEISVEIYVHRQHDILKINYSNYLIDLRALGNDLKSLEYRTLNIFTR